MDPELECFDAETGKAGGYGELKNGMLFAVSLGLARRLLGDGKKLRQLRIRKGEVGTGKKADAGGDGAKPLPGMSTGVEVLDELGSRFAFELAVGRNGRVWVDSESVKTTLCVGRCIQESEFLTGEEQKRMVMDMIREFEISYP